LTGHVGRAYGNCAAIVPNSQALSMRLPQALQAAGEPFGERWEISRLFREDFEFVNGASSFVDLHSANNLPSTATPRGHQYPGAFLIEAAGMRKSKVPFMHLDIASVAEESTLGKPSAFGVASLMNYFDISGKE
jgi:leucyl aminopeptidase